MNVGLEGEPPSFSCCLCFLVDDAFQKHHPGALSLPACWLGPTQEALIPRSGLLASGLATQAVPLVPLPSLPRPIPLSLAWSGPPPPRRGPIRQGWPCAFTHRWARKAWLALKSLREEGRTVCCAVPSVLPGQQVERGTGWYCF